MSEKRVVFDLGGTLVTPPLRQSGSQLRPGTIDLLAGLRADRVEPIVWTAGSASDTLAIMEKFPELNGLLGRILYDGTSPSLYSTIGEWKRSNDPEQAAKAVTLAEWLGRLGDVKLPSVVGALALVDDRSDQRQAVQDLGELAIDPNSRMKDTSPDQWAERVYAAILSHLK